MNEADAGLNLEKLTGSMHANRHLEARTKSLALRIIRLVEALPRGEATRVIGRQIPRSDTSVGANYRAVQWARSRVDMIAKLKIFEEEADETVYWLEILHAA